MDGSLGSVLVYATKTGLFLMECKRRGVEPERLGRQQFKVSRNSDELVFMVKYGVPTIDDMYVAREVVDSYGIGV